MGYFRRAVLRLSEREAHRRLKRRNARRHLPPPEYRQLFGISEPLEQAMANVEAEDGPSFVSIEGMGGENRIGTRTTRALRRWVIVWRNERIWPGWLGLVPVRLTPHGELQPLDPSAAFQMGAWPDYSEFAKLGEKYYNALTANLRTATAK